MKKTCQHCGYYHDAKLKCGPTKEKPIEIGSIRCNCAGCQKLKSTRFRLSFFIDGDYFIGERYLIRRGNSHVIKTKIEILVENQKEAKAFLKRNYPKNDLVLSKKAGEK